MSKFELNVTKLKKSCVNCREHLDNYKRYCDRIYDNLKMIKNSWIGIDSDTFCKIFSNDFVEYEDLYNSINKKQNVLDEFASKLEHFITENGYSQDEDLILYFDSNEINKCYSLFDRIDQKARHADEKICIDYWNPTVDCDKLNEVLEKMREANSDSSRVKESISTLQRSIEQLFSTNSINSDTLSVFTISNHFIEYSSPAVSFVNSFSTSNGETSKISNLSIDNTNSSEYISTIASDDVENPENLTLFNHSTEISEEGNAEKTTAVFEQQNGLTLTGEKEDVEEKTTAVFEQQNGLTLTGEKEDVEEKTTALFEQQNGLTLTDEKEDVEEKTTVVFEQQNGLNETDEKEDVEEKTTAVFEQQNGLNEMDEKEDVEEKIAAVFEQNDGLDDLTKKDESEESITPALEQQRGFDELTEDKDISVSTFKQDTKDIESKMDDEDGAALNTFDEIKSSENTFENAFLDKEYNPNFETMSGINTNGNIDTVGVDSFEGSSIQGLDSIDADSVSSNTFEVEIGDSNSSLQGLDHNIDQIDDN